MLLSSSESLYQQNHEDLPEADLEIETDSLLLKNEQLHVSRHVPGFALTLITLRTRHFGLELRLLPTAKGILK